MTSIFKQIEEDFPKLEGWCPVPKMLTFAVLTLNHRFTLAVDIGVFGGRSTLPIALAMKENGHGSIIGIDPWSAVESEKGQTHPADKEWWGKLDHEAIYQGFIKQREDLGLRDYISIHRAPSDTVTPPKDIDFLHCDGNHGPDALRDIVRFSPNVKVGGFCCLDDLKWDGGFVGKGEAHILENGFERLYDIGTGAMYRRVK